MPRLKFLKWLGAWCLASKGGAVFLPYFKFKYFYVSTVLAVLLFKIEFSIGRNQEKGQISFHFYKISYIILLNKIKEEATAVLLFYATDDGGRNVITI